MVLVIKSELASETVNYNTVTSYLYTSYLSVFSPTAGKYGPQKTPYLDTFHAVKTIYQFEVIWGHCRWNNRFQKQSFVDTIFAEKGILADFAEKSICCRKNPEAVTVDAL